MKKALIFDMDGVIVDNYKFHIRSWQEFAKRYGRKVEYDEVKTWFGNTNKMILKKLFDHELTDEEIREMSIKKEEVYRDLYRKDIQALPGLRDFLEKIRNSDYIPAIATAAPTENVDFVLSSTGLSSYFDIITDDSMISHGKPDPEIFLKTAERLKIQPVYSLVFEDSHHGIEAAKRAGMKVVAVATTHRHGELSGADKIISDFREIGLNDLEHIFNT